MNANDSNEQEQPDLLQQTLDSFEENAPKSKDQFYHKSFNIFSKLNKLVKGNDSVELKESKKTQISDIVLEYVDLVHEYPNTSKFVPIWDLANILYFSNDENNLAVELNYWINEQEALPEYTENDNLYKIREIALHHMLRGNIIEAIEALNSGLLDLNGIQTTTVKIIIHLLEEFESLQQNRDDKMNYISEWTKWQNDCKIQLEKYCRLLDDNEEDVKINDDIKVFLYVLSGDEDSIIFGGSYFERIIGCILYSRPTITMNELPQLAQKLNINKSELNECVYIIMGCFDDAFEFSHDLWLQTHLGHALIAVGAKSTEQIDIESIEKEYIIDPIYYCIYDYATMLAETNNLWEEAIIYLTACVENREIWIKNLLNETALKSKDMNLLNFVLEVSKENNMIHVKQYIHKIIGHRYEEKKDIKNATIEYGKAHDLESLDRFAHHEFSQYLKTGKLGDVVTNMEELKESPHYALLILYHNFKAYLLKKELEKASELFLELLGYDRLPTKFEMVLLTDNLVILEDSKLHYNLDQLKKQIKLFKTVTTKPTDQEFLATYYEFIYHKEFPSDVVTAIVREKMVHKAVIASN